MVNLSDFNKNRKEIKKIRDREEYILQYIKDLNKNKIDFFKAEERYWNNLRTKIVSNQNITFILKNGFRLNSEKMIELAKEDKVEELLNTFHIGSKVLLESTENDIRMKSLIEEERHFINQMIIMHYPLIVQLVSKPTKKASFLRNYFYEIYNEGILGLIHSIYKYETGHGAKFVTYAYKWIIYYINKYVDNLIKNIDFNNGNYNIHQFENGKVLECEYKDYIKSLHNSKIDLINLFEKIDFITEDKLHNSYNQLMNNHSSRRDLLHYASQLNDNEINKILSCRYDDKIIARLLLEHILPLRKSNIENNRDEFISSQDSLSKEENHNDHYINDILSKILDSIDLSDEDRLEIDKFIESGNLNRRVKHIIQKVKSNKHIIEKYRVGL